ncbi:SAF domain-containing protein [Nocardioides caldifontis]|uniref:SAF domain-containing protein n=1 Tax=Nocardioides caldifontis TaxID=2588938 RepID=UPI0013968E26|nr:SAF domain-containing protein [Nocardioides caldifontis]
MSALRTPAATTPTSPPATRGPRPSWRDPRLAAGLLLVFGSVLVGAKVLAGADDTVAVLTAARPLASGQELRADDLGTVRLRFEDEAEADRYLTGDVDAAVGAVLVRPVGQGELVPRAALGGTTDGLVELPLSVDPGRVPSSVRAGSVVDVWATGSEETATDEQAAERVLSAVPVLSVSRGAGTRQVVVGVAGDDEDLVAGVVGRLGGEASVLVVARSGEDG